MKKRVTETVQQPDPIDLNSVLSIRNRFDRPKFVHSYQGLSEVVTAHKNLKKETKVVLVLGTYDLLHIGHARFLQRCREAGDIVVVIIDPDHAVQKSKAKHEVRPIVPEWERLEIVAHLMHVDYVAFMDKDDYHGETGLWLRMPPFRPDVLVISERNPTDEVHIEACREICDQLIVLQSQAQTSTTAKIRRVWITRLQHAEQILTERIQNVFSELRGE
jgi:cytidyltransferase-like protein